jgi:hypothetical protein
MVHLIWERSDGEVIKGLTECTVQSTTEKQMVDSDLNHGVVTPGGETSDPQIVTVRTFSWVNNGDPSSPITDAVLYIDGYYSEDPTYEADAGKAFCGDADTAVFGDYEAAGGSHSASSDLSTILGWGDGATGDGVQVSLDLGRTYQTFKTGTGDSPANGIVLSATAMDVGTTDGQLEPGDRARLFFRISVPSTFTSPSNAGVYLFTIGMFYNYTE